MQPPAPIRFIGSGNYHYLTYLFLKRLTSNFTLLLFDYHTDMLPAAFGNLLSCGNWLRFALDNLPHLKQAFIVGAQKNLIDKIPASDKHRVVCFDTNSTVLSSDWVYFLKHHIDYPVYLSIDKDVFSFYDVQTNWEQGDLRVTDFLNAFQGLLPTLELLAVDICGESDAQPYQNSTVNHALLHFFLQNHSSFSVAA